jgi:ABC-type nitrate/sulfonate/bicarbonate transport system ATPase subunit
MSVAILRLCKSYAGKPVIQNLDLNLPDRGLVGLTGPSGCGKTTLLCLLAGLEKPDSGWITGIEPRQVSMVFQEDRLLPWLSAEQNLTAVLPEPGEAQAWLEKMQLRDWAGHFPAELSGGMKRRIALARALGFPSQLLLLDEPFTGLDEDLKIQMAAYVRESAQTRLVLVVSHDRSDLARLGGPVLQAAGPPLSLEANEQLASMP